MADVLYHNNNIFSMWSRYSMIFSWYEPKLVPSDLVAGLSYRVFEISFTGIWTVFKFKLFFWFDLGMICYTSTFFSFAFRCWRHMGEFGRFVCDYRGVWDLHSESMLSCSLLFVFTVSAPATTTMNLMKMKWVKYLHFT